MPTLGVLLDERILGKILRRRPTFEAVRLYESPAREFGLDLMLLQPRSIDRRRRLVHGYTLPDLRPRVAAVPPVVHNRALQYRSSNRDMRWLARQGIKVFNPLVPAGKYAKHLLLSQSPELRPHLPATRRLPARGSARVDALMRRSGQLFVKPNTGSLGRGIIRVERLTGGKYRVDGRRRRILGRHALRRETARVARQGPHILQEGVLLAKYRGRPFDLRVYLQRGEGGHWTVPGMAARQAQTGRFLTNLARGGTAHRVGEVLPSAFPHLHPREVYDRVVACSLAAGRAVARHYPAVADLGLDVGLDSDAHPWILEVNLRMLRLSLRDTGEHEAWAQAYRNPVAYAHHLLTTPPNMDTPAPA